MEDSFCVNDLIKDHNMLQEPAKVRGFTDKKLTPDF